MKKNRQMQEDFWNLEYITWTRVCLKDGREAEEEGRGGDRRKEGTSVLAMCTNMK